jgi:glutamate racemase
MREKNNMRLAVMDWGIGGLPLFQALRAARPDADLLYISDSGSVPYGRQSPPMLRGRLEEIAAFVGGQGIKTLAAACNAMSSILPAAASPIGAVEVLSVIHAFTGGLAGRGAGLSPPFPRRGRVVGVIGGVRTIESGIYQRALEGAGWAVRSCPAQELSALIEAGDFDAIPGFLEKILSVLGGIDALVLACTHYPAVSPIIERLAPDLAIIDPGSALRDLCLRRLSGPGEQAGSGPAGGRSRYFSTGSAEDSRRAAETAFGFAGLPFEHIAIDLKAAGFPS